MLPLTDPIIRRRWIFLAFLGSLHLVLLQGPESTLGRLLFLAHIGIGLLWQPFVRANRRFGFAGSALVVCAAALFAHNLDWVLLLVWLLLLTGVAGGKIFLFPCRWERSFHLIALAYLASALLMLALPRLLDPSGSGAQAVDWAILYGAPLAFVVMAVLPRTRPDNDPVTHDEIVDFVYGVMVFLLLATVALGSLSFALLTQTGYFESLLKVLALVAVALLLLGVIWNPRAGFGGLGGALAQHITSLGLPVEAWLESLAVLAREEVDAERFIARACAELPQRQPGVTGGRWATPHGEGEFGVRGGHVVTFAYERLRLEFDCRVAPSPGLHWHHELTARLLAEFYLGKWRARELQRLAYAEAIHTTGARLTHDVKNLLQSLETLCAAAEETQTPASRFGALLRRQLPEIAARLRLTLGKLAAPTPAGAGVKPEGAGVWLQRLRNRHPDAWLTVDADDATAAAAIDDPELFDSVADNLLQNIVDKRRGAPGVRGVCTLHAQAGTDVRLEIGDDGAAIPAALAAALLRGWVPSENGLGVGLYQSAQLAEERGWRLELADNRPGAVTFRLRRRP